MAALKDYLKSLNSSESGWGVWVNPENPKEDFRIGQFCFENGGMKDNYICIGSLEALSFAYQYRQEALEEYLRKGQIEYKGKLVRLNPKAMIDSFFNLCEEFRAFLEEEIESILEEWAELEAEFFVAEKLPEILRRATEETEEYAAA